MGKWIVAILSAGHLSADPLPCERTEGAVYNHERVLLAAAARGRAEEVARPLYCLLDTQANGEGMARVYAASALRPLLGGAQIEGVMRDRRYAQASKLLETLTARSADPLRDSVVARFAEGDWTFYKIFCEQGDTAYCTAFLPDEKNVRDQVPLLAAAAMLRLRKAYDALNGKPRAEVAQRLRNLYREIPRDQSIQRQFIDKIYEELFGRELTLA